MIDEIRRTVRVRSDSGSLFKRISERLARIDLTVLGTGVGVTTTPGARYSNPLTIWRTCIDELGGVPLVLICIDDAELIEPAGLGTLKTLGESSGDVPVMLAVAGGPDFLARLSQRGSSPVARVFSGATFDMEELRLDETREAVLAPVRASGGRATGIWADAAIARIQDLSHGSPYLVQCLAYAAYRDESEITEGGVDASIRAAVTVAEPWLRQEIPHASDEDILSFLKLAETRKPNFRSAEILGLGIQSPYVGRLVDKCSCLPVITNDGRRRLEVAHE